MNVFYLDIDFISAAKSHCDQHVRKMVIEYAQMLSSAHLVLDGFVVYRIRKAKNGQWRRTRQYLTQDSEMNRTLYLPTHINHPSSAWVRQADANYVWLYNMWVALLSEYVYRFDKRHASEQLAPVLAKIPKRISHRRDLGHWNAPPIAIKNKDIHLPSVVDSYRNYYNLEKSKFATWTKRKPPIWYKAGEEYVVSL